MYCKKGFEHREKGIRYCVSAIIENKIPIKHKDLGSPTISVTIGETHIEKALLDLGVSVNILPYSIYKQFGLGELKPTNITLSLVDRSKEKPRGILEDVLVQVDTFWKICCLFSQLCKLSPILSISLSLGINANKAH